MKQKYFLGLLLATLLGFATSCNETDPPYPDNTVNFSTAELGIAESDSLKAFTVNLDYAETSDISVTLGIAASGAEYGTDFILTPVATDNLITLTIPAGSTSASIQVKKKGKFFEGSEAIVFSIQSVEGKPAYGSLALGATASLKLSFSPIISEGASITLQGGAGGSNAANSVFLDFSSNEQTAVARAFWNLGFYNGSTFAVKLNNTMPTTALATTLDIADVISKADSTTYINQLTLSYSDKFAYLDDLSGDVSGTVIKDDGRVYLANFVGVTPQLYKVKVSLKNNDTYTLQYASSNSSAVKTIDIPKNSKHNYTYVSFTSNGMVNVEPEAAKWDIQWTKAIYKTWNADLNSYIPYTFSDLVFINKLAGVTAAEVFTSVVSYANFSLSYLPSITFSSDVDVIGSKWRVTTGDGVKKDRFYVIKDPAGNVYKLQFLKMGVNDSGTRGYPQIEYALVQ
jgi:hypothetical protein